VAADRISLVDARRIALLAQGFGKRPKSRPSTDAILGCVERLGVVQLDSVNVVCRAHYLPLLARLGAYDRDLIDTAAWSPPRRLFEYWGHEASFLPVAMQPLFRWRMARAETGRGMWSGIARFGRERRAYVEEVLKTVAESGPLRPADLPSPTRARGGWWERSDAKRALEWLFWAGKVTTASRRHFARLYDLPERVLPADVIHAPTPSEEDAHRELLRIAGRALGIATADDLCDYFRLARKDAQPRLDDLVEDGALAPALVEGWTKPAFLDANAKANANLGTKPRRPLQAAALLAPFDPLVWYRPRAHRLFDFHYRIGIYTPAHARTHGYYVLPFLSDGRLVGRVDLKAERTKGVLEVKSAHVEDGADPEAIAPALGVELTRLGGWLGLDRVVVFRKGKLAPALRSCLRGRAELAAC
jgi:uncharacterized protein YcaQ